MEKIRGETTMHSHNGEVESHMHFNAGGSSGEKRPVDERLSDLADRAGGFAGRVRGSVEDHARSAASRIDERTGAVSLVRNNPLAAVGIAFVAGFAVAAISETRERSWVIERARRQLRAAILSGLTAVAVREFRSILGEENIGEFFSSFLDSEDDGYEV